MFAALLILKTNFEFIKAKEHLKSKSRFIIVLMENKKYHKQIYFVFPALLVLHTDYVLSRLPPLQHLFNSFQGIWIRHDSISGKCQLIGPKYAPYYHPRNALSYH